MSVQAKNYNPVKFLCNSCLTELKLFDEIPSTGGHAKKRYWTNCKHVLCHSCRIRLTDKCAACNQKCKFMEISRQMPPNFRFYFEPQLKLRDNLTGSVKFQQDQSELIIKRSVSLASSNKTKGRQTVTKCKEIHGIYRQLQLEKVKIVKIFDNFREEKKRRDAQKRLSKTQQKPQNDTQWERSRGHRHDIKHPTARSAHNNPPRNVILPRLYDNNNHSNIPKPNEPWTPASDAGFVDITTARFEGVQRPTNPGSFSTPEFP